MLRAFLIPIEWLCGIVALLVVFELINGTPVYFTAMMGLAVLSIGVTYNLLGGLRTMSGWIFVGFAARNLVISQFAKVLLGEPADRPLEEPLLTITVYAVFYVSAMVGVYLFGKIRFALPRPATSTRISGLYWFVMPVGLIGMAVLESQSVVYGTGTQLGAAHSLGLALSPLVLFSLILAIDLRLQQTNGRHSVSLKMVAPAAAYMFSSFINSVRQSLILPVIIYAVVCVLRKYRFSLRHYIALGVFGTFFVFFYSPFALFNRAMVSNETLKNRMVIAFDTLKGHHDPAELLAFSQGVATESENASRETYYSRPGTAVLNRFSLIRPDSNVVAACANGYHYGFKAISIDVANTIPRFVGSERHDELSGGDFVGRVTGMSADAEGLTSPVFTAIADSYGAFGWAGVVLYPLIFIPFILIVIESVYDLNTSWGIVGVGMTFLIFGELNMGRTISLAIRLPLTIVVLSHLVNFAVNFLPLSTGKRDRSGSGSLDQGDSAV